MPSYPTYRPPAPYNSGSVLDLIMQRGDIAAQRAQQSGAIWGNALQGAASVLAGGIQQHAEQSNIKKRDEAWLSFVESGEWQHDPAKAYAMTQRIWGPEKAGPQFAALQGVMNLRGAKRDPEKDAKSLGAVIGAMEDLDENGRKRIFPQVHALTSSVYPEIQYGPDYDPERWPEISAIGKQLRGDKPAGTREVKVRNADGSETIQIVPDTPGQTFNSAAEPPKPDTRGIEVQAAEALARGDTATYNRLLRVRKEVGQADDRPINITQSRPLSQTAEANLLQNFSKEWSTAAAPAQMISRQVGIMEAGLEAARRGDLNAGSQAVIQTYNKILDPDSAVREGEYARTAEGQAALTRLAGAWERLQSGGANIPLKELETFAALARDIAAKQQAYLPAVRSRIGKKADRYGLPPELIFGDDTPPPPPPPPPSTTGGARPVAPIPNGATPGPRRVSSIEEAMRLPKGTQFIDPAGILRTRP